MATLTSSGVNCSNGTLDGYYTGTSSSNTSYPIGTYLYAFSGTCVVPAFNATITVNVPTSAGNSYSGINGAFGGNNAPGTWRFRGANAYGSGLVQRVA